MMFTQRDRSLGFAFVTFFVLGLSTSFGAITIDSFEYHSDKKTTYSTKNKEDNVKLWFNNDRGIGTILGSYRDGVIGCRNGSTGSVKAIAGKGSIQVLSEDSDAGPSLFLSYDGTQGWADRYPEQTPFNGQFSQAIDLTESGQNHQFAFNFLNAHEQPSGDGTLTFGMFKISLQEKRDDAGTAETMEYNFTELANTWMKEHYNDLDSGTSAQFLVDFKDHFKGTDLSNIGAIQFHICSQDIGATYELGGISVIPEPTSLAMISLVTLLGFAMRRRLCA